MDESVDMLIANLANRQRGYVTRQQLLKLGLGPDAVRYRIRIGRLIPVYAGVYAVGHLPTLPQDRAVGALLACGAGAVLSHSSAATLWGIFKRWEMPFEVTARTIRQRLGIRIHRAVLGRQDISYQAGIRVTSPARTLLDIAPRMTDKALTRAVNDLRRPGYLRLDQLAELLSRFPRNPGSGRLRPWTIQAVESSSPNRPWLMFTSRIAKPRAVSPHTAARTAQPGGVIVRPRGVNGVGGVARPSAEERLAASSCSGG